MKRIAFIAFCLLTITAQLPAQTSRDTELPDAFAGKQLLWERELGTHQYSIPSVDGDRLYLGTNDWGLEHPAVESTGGSIVHCLDRATGGTIWQLPIPRYMQGTQAPYHFNHFRCGLCSQVMVQGDRLYVIGTRGSILCLDRDGQADGNDGPFTDELSFMKVPTDSDYQLQPSDGDIVWRYDLLTELGVYPHDVCGSNVLIDGDLLYACTSNGKDDRHNLIANPDAPSLIVLDKKTGQLLATDGGMFGSTLFHGNWSSPVMAEVDGTKRILFGGGDGFMYAFEPYKTEDDSSGAGQGVGTLKVAWRVDCNRPEYRTREDGTPITYTPVGRKTYEGPSELIARPVIYKGRVYAPIGQSPNHGPGPGQLSCIDIKTGEVVWQNKDVDRSILDVAIDNGLLYLPDYTGTMHCIDPETGQHVWRYEMGRFGAWTANPVVHDGKVFVGTEKDKTLRTFAAGREPKLLEELRLPSPPGTPVFADGVCYFPTQRKILAIRYDEEKVKANPIVRSRRTALIQILALQAAFDDFYGDTQSYPSTEQGIKPLFVRPKPSPDDPDSSWDGPYIRLPDETEQIPKDPWDNEFRYASPTSDGKKPKIWSVGPDGKSGTYDDVWPEGARPQ